MTSSERGPPGETPPSRVGPRARRRIGPPIAAATLTLAISIGVGVYLARGPIAEALARDWLGQYGVATRLRIHSLSLTGLSADVRLGAAADPDLTVERLDVGYGLSGPWNGAPFGVQTRSLRLVRPHLKARLANGRLNLGALQPLVDEMARRPSKGGRPPDIVIEDGVVVVLTPQGALTLRGSGSLKAGAVAVLNARVDPFRLSLGDVQLSSAGAALQAAQQGPRLATTVDIGFVTLAQGASHLSANRVSLSGEWPNTSPKGWVGAVRVALSARGVAAAAGQTHASGGALDGDLDAVLSASAAGQTLTGRMLVSSQFAVLATGAAQARNVNLRLDLANLRVNRQAGTASALADGTLSLAAGDVRGGGGALALKADQIQIHSIKVSDQHGQLTGSASLEGALAGRGGFDMASARRLSRALPDDQDALEEALRSFTINAPRWRAQISDRQGRLTLGAPLTIVAASGAKLSMSAPASALSLSPNSASGSGALDIGGGGLPVLHLQASQASISAAGVRADLSAQAAIDTSIIGGADLALNGRLTGAPNRLRFDLASCVQERVRRVVLGTASVTALAARLCPGDGPLLTTGPAGWIARGRLEDANADLTDFTSAIRAANGSFKVQGKAGPNGATILLDRGSLIDIAAPKRFKAVSMNGRLDLLAGRLAGDFSASTEAGRSVGKVHLRHDMTSGVGRADIDAGAVTFAPGGLQPGELSPVVNFAREAEGSASFTGWFAWRQGGVMTSGGELAAKALKFTSPVGSVLGIDADLHFTSLAPLISAPDQQVSAALINAVTPLSGLSAQFDLGADSLTIDTAKGGVAQGRIYLEPMTAPLKPGATLKSALVVDQVDIGQIIAASSLADSLKMDAVVTGRIPFELGPAGLTIQNGALTAVRPGRLSISRKGLGGGSAAASVERGAPAATAVSAQANVGEDLAFQAMDNLAFEKLEASVNSQPGDRLGILFHIKGRHDPPQRQRATIALKDLLRGQPLAKPLTLPSDTQIDLTLDTSLNFGQLVQALGQAWRDSTDGDSEPRRSDPVQGPGSTAPVK